ncbi:MAG: type 1 glutamine amidotransferase [Opitutaceae bacterium]
MRVHVLQHVAFEGLGTMERWLLARGHRLSWTRLHAGEPLPATAADFDWLIAMGGPMNVYQYRDHPWLGNERRLIGDAVAAGRRVLGVCMGAQLIADALGGKVFQNEEREIGWFPVRAVPGGAASPFRFPAETRAFHWHGDTFSLPTGSTWLAESAGCAHQAFAVGTRVLALQFHLEMTGDEIGRLAKACVGELGAGRYIQPEEALVAGAEDINGAAILLDQLLAALEAG